MNDSTTPARVDHWAKIAALIATLATILSGISALQVSRFETRLKQVQAERELNFKIYASIADALESGDPKRVLAVRGIVDAMASDSIKPKFLEALEPAIVGVFEQQQLALGSQSEPLVEHNNGDSAGEIEQPIAPGSDSSVVTPAPTGTAASETWGEWDIDIFWCASGGLVAENDANKIRAWLVNDNAKGRIRSRVLPESVNQKSGYGASGFEIRRGKDEINIANKLEDFIGRIPDLGSKDWRQRITTQSTPWYISVFICP